MTKLSEGQQQFLEIVQYGTLFIQFSYKKSTINSLIRKMYIRPVPNQRVSAVGFSVEITPAGLAYLYQDAPMVDQPQPAPEGPILFDGLHANELSYSRLVELYQSTKHWILESEMNRRVIAL